MEEENPEFLLRKNRDKLELALKGNMKPILDDLYEKNLLSHDVYEKLQDPKTKLNSVEEVRLVLSCILDKVKLKAKRLDTFITLLSEPKHKGRYEDAVEILQPYEMKKESEEPIRKKRKYEIDSQEDELQKSITVYGSRQALLTLVTQFKRDVNMPINGERETFLHLACKAGHLDVVRTLVEVCGCNINALDKFGNTPCFSACSHGHLKILDYFWYCSHHLKCNGLNFLSYSNDDGDTLLHAACLSGSLPLVRWVILTSLSQVHLKLNMYNDEVFSYLLNDPNRKENYRLPVNKSNYSPLHSACFKNHCEVIKHFFSEFRSLFETDLFNYLPTLKSMAYKLGRNDILKYLSTTFKSNSLACQFVTEKKKKTENVSFSSGHNWSHRFSNDRSGMEYSKFPNVLLQNCMQPSASHSMSSIETANATSLFSLKISHRCFDVYIPETEHLVFYAVRCGDKAYRDLLRISSLDTRNEKGDTLLHAACVSGDIHIVKDIYDNLLLNNSWKEDELIVAKNNMGNTCLHLACEWGLIEIAKFLIHKNFSLNEVNKFNQTPLHISVLYQRFEIFEYLLCLDIDLLKMTSLDETILHIASADHELFKYAQKIVRHSLFSKDMLNVKDKFGETPIFNAFRLPTEYRKEMVDILKGSDLCLANGKYETLAYIASRLKDTTLLDDVLSQKNYPVQNQNIFKQTLLQVILSLDDLSIANYIKEKKIGIYVYKIKDDVNLVDTVSDLAPLQSAYHRNDYEAFIFLLSIEDCHLDTQNLKDGDTLLHLICRNYNESLAKECLDRCSVYIINKDKNTPLHIAAINKHLQVLMHLLDGITDDISSLTNNEGNNLLHIVSSCEDGEDVLHKLLANKLVSVLSKNSVTGDTALHIAVKKRLLPNLLCLLKYFNELQNIDYQSLCISDGQTPFHELVIGKDIQFFEKLVQNCEQVLYYPCTFNMQLSVEPNILIRMPVLFCFINFTNQMRRRSGNYLRYKLVQSILSDEKRHKDIFQLHDSHGNTLLHYVALFKRDGYLDNTLDEYFHSIMDLSLQIQGQNINAFNSGRYSPFHYACFSGNDIMIWKLLQHPEGSKFINEESDSGPPAKLYRPCSYSDAVHFLISNGANYCEKKIIPNFTNLYPSLKVFVFGDSGVGKTTLIDAINRMLLNRQKSSYDHITRTIGLCSSRTFFQDMYYCFNDFGGEVELEMVRSASLQSYLLSASESLTPLPLYIILVVKSTDSYEDKKEQIDRWIVFLTKHVKETVTSVHVILVSTHKDQINVSLSTEENIFHYFQSIIASTQFIPNNLEIVLNGTIRDSIPLGLLRQYFEKTFSASKSKSLSDTAKIMLYYLDTKYPSLCRKFSQLKEEIREQQKFELTDHRIIRLAQDERVLRDHIIPHDDRSLSNCIAELHDYGSISLLLNSCDKEDCWVVNTKVETILHNHIMAFLMQGKIQDIPYGLQESNNIGLIPEAELLMNCTGEKLSIDSDAIIPYLISTEFCIRVSPDQLGSIADHENFEKDQLLFIPSLIERNRDPKAHIDLSGQFIVKWSLQCKSCFDVVFKHRLLLNLALKYAPADNSHYRRKLFIWKSGLYWCADNEIEVSVEVCEGNKICLIFHSSAEWQNMVYVFTKYRCEVIQEVRNIRKESLLQEYNSEDETEYFHYPVEQLMQNDSKFSVSDMLTLFKKKVNLRTMHDRNHRAVALDKVLLFDPFLYLEPSLLRNLHDSRFLENCKFAKKFQDFLAYLRNEPKELSLSVLQAYSIFDAQDISRLFN